MKERRLELLNEFLSDQYLSALTDLLTKQFYETDVLLKQTMQKYIDEGLSESTSIKQHFQIDYNSLEGLKAHMPEQKYNATLKQLKLSEANVLRQASLIISRLAAEEEARIRRELDRKHMSEQVELRQNISVSQAKLRMQLVGETALGNLEID